DQPIRFQGQQFDLQTGLHYNRFRYYDPAIGRYISADPTRLIAGPNFFSYVNSKPNSYVDPKGLQLTTPAEAQALIKQEGIMPPSRKIPLFSSPHVYDHKTEICKTSAPTCNLEKVHGCVKRFPAPGAVGEEPVYDGAVSNVKLPGGISGQDHVLHGVDNVNHIVTNSTLGDHMLNPGWVKRSTKIDNDGISVFT
ncbi:RHS repeat-associated core domain-containing protein, partial [Sphingomonas sp. NCPPB 2930]